MLHYMTKTGLVMRDFVIKRRISCSARTRRFEKMRQKGHRARYGPGVRRLGPPKVSIAAPGQQSQGQLWASPYMAEARANDRLGCP